MSIREDQVRHVAKLARLRLTDDETRSMTADLVRILDYVDKLSQLDTSQVEPTSNITGAVAPMRDDVCSGRDKAAAAEEAVSGAPRRDGTFFAVPPIIE